MKPVRAAALASGLLVAIAAVAGANTDSKVNLNPNFNARLAAPQPTAEDRYESLIRLNAKTGPVQIALRDQAMLNLPDGYAFLPEKPARDITKKFGNPVDDNFIGLVLPMRRSDWCIFLEFVPTGFIRDDDARHWDTNAMLAQVRTNTESANVQRRAQGVPELEILGWVEMPRYDAASHDLIWSISARDKGATGAASDIINYKALVLGRQGYVSLVLVTSLAAIGSEKVIANTLAAGTHFDTGKRYGDFNASTDRVAEYGLAALVGGLVVKKLGLFAIIGALLLKSVKFIGLLAVGALAWFRRLFRCGKPAATPLIVATEASVAAAATPQPSELK